MNGGRWLRHDMALSIACNRWGRRQRVHRVFAVVSQLGDGALWYALMAAIVAVDGWHGLAVSVQLAGSAGIALLLYFRLKRCTRRLRPFASDARVRALVTPLDEFSFPSGHTLHATVFTTVALAHYPALGWLLVPFTLAIAASRVVLGVHYPSDVLAALAIGLALAGISIACWP